VNGDFFIVQNTYSSSVFIILFTSSSTEIDSMISVLDTKNHESHTLPLSNYLYELLLSRSLRKTNDYVFPGTGAAGYIIEPRKQMVHVTKASGVHFTVHDLRRTFITIAEGLDISAYALKRLMNHKMNGDITAGYIVADVERLRKPMQQITDYILKCMGATPPTDILTIQPASKGNVHEERA